MENKDIVSQIQDVLEKIRPFINRDGGDLEFVKFEDGYVYIKMLGACDGCDLINMTISEGIEAILKDEVDGILGVKLDKPNS